MTAEFRSGQLSALWRKAVAAALTTLAVCVLAAPAHAGSSSSSAKAWADGVCSAVSTFGESVDSTLTSLKTSSSLDDASQKAKTGLDSAAQTLEASLQELGKPPTSDSAQAQAEVQQAGDDLSSAVTNIESLLTPAPTSPQQIASTFAQIGLETQKAVQQCKSSAATLKGLEPDGALKKALQTAPACKQLKSSL